MKVAVSIPDSTFARVEVLAQQMRLPRSKVYARALDDFVANQTAGDLTASINAALAEIMEDENQLFVMAGAKTVLANTEW
jgi:predicted transcriptional regulator